MSGTLQTSQILAEPHEATQSTGLGSLKQYVSHAVRTRRRRRRDQCRYGRDQYEIAISKLVSA